MGLPRDTVLRRLAHVPIGWRPTLLHVAVRRYRCLRCGHVWRQDTTAAAEPRSKLSRSAVLWASWHTVNVAVLTAGRALLIEDPTRVEGVRDLTSVPAGAGPARLLDMVSGRSRAVFTTWLNRQCPAFLAGIETVAMDGFTGYTSSATEAVPDAVAVMNPFHVVALAGDATGPLLPTPAAGDLWAPRPDRDPVYGSRRVLGAGAGLLTN